MWKSTYTISGELRYSFVKKKISGQLLNFNLIVVNHILILHFFFVIAEESNTNQERGIHAITFISVFILG